MAGNAVEIYETWARAKNYDEGDIDKTKDILRMAAMLHDIGKIGIPDGILKKPGRLDESEFKIVKEHTPLGASFFFDKRSISTRWPFVAVNHHERWDGKGYPGHIDLANGEPTNGHKGNGKGAKGKQGEEIPALARIVSVSDVYDALRSQRSYKEAYEESKAIELIRSESGKAFDPEVVEAFLVACCNFQRVASQYQDII